MWKVYRISVRINSFENLIHIKNIISPRVPVALWLQSYNFKKSTKYMLCWGGNNRPMKMRETSRGVKWNGPFSIVKQYG